MKAITEMLSSSGIPIPSKAKKQLRKLFKKPSPSPDFESSLLPPLVAYMFHERLKRLVKRLAWKRYTEKELKLILAEMKADGRELPTVIRKALNQMRQTLPRRGGPGREEILSITEKREVCEDVTKLLKMGTVRKMPDIYATVAEGLAAKGKKVSARTIKRVWEKRQSLYVG